VITAPWDPRDQAYPLSTAAPSAPKCDVRVDGTGQGHEEVATVTATAGQTLIRGDVENDPPVAAKKLETAGHLGKVAPAQCGPV
jgi:hypothetical protein